MKALSEKIDQRHTLIRSSLAQLGLLLTLTFLLVLGSQHSADAQELRLNGHAVISGSGASLPGFGIGAEAPIGKLFSTAIDVNYGMHRLGSVIFVKPSLNFYFSKKQTGIFIGPTLNYFSLINKKQAGEERQAGSSMYGFGFNFGGKANLTEKLNMHMVFSPQGSIGPFNGVKLSANIQFGIGFKL